MIAPLLLPAKQPVQPCPNNSPSDFRRLWSDPTHRNPMRHISCRCSPPKGHSHQRPSHGIAHWHMPGHTSRAPGDEKHQQPPRTQGMRPLPAARFTITGLGQAGRPPPCPGLWRQVSDCRQVAISFCLRRTRSASPCNSTFRRTTGSVLDLRRLNRHSPISNDTPSRSSRPCACGP